MLSKVSVMHPWSSLKMCWLASTKRVNYCLTDMMTALLQCA